jgi:aryl-alcohol dehydrogenase-like predicted oxidoreductase
VSDASPVHIREACERSLRSLNTDRIWLYQLHAPDPKVAFEKSVEAFAELQREGKFEHFGLSNVSVAQIDQARAILPVLTVQNRLNPYFRESIKVARGCASATSPSSHTARSAADVCRRSCRNSTC